MTDEQGSYCGGCGRRVDEGDHDRCARLLRYDPARFCDRCGFRLDVQVYPDRVTTSCRECRRRARGAARAETGATAQKASGGR